MRPRTLSLTFPLGGLHRALGYQSQPPYTCYDAQNVRGTEILEKRGRGGSRPGLKEQWAKHANMGEACRCLAVVDYVDSGVLKEAIVFVEASTAPTLGDLFHSSNETTWTQIATAFAAGSSQLFAAQRLQRLYISNPDGTGLGVGATNDVRVFNPTVAPATIADLTISTGVPPDKCRLLTIYNDRLVLAKDNQFWMSRMGDPTDWNYACDIDDPKRAVSSTTSETGQLGEPITAIMPLSNDLLLVGCMNSLHLIRGDLTYGGRMDPLSRTLGIVAEGALCQGPTGEVYFLSRDGVYVIRGVSVPEPVSRQKLPNELLMSGATGYAWNMIYNIAAHGIHIFVTPKPPWAADGTHWFLDLWNGAFWKDRYPREAQPLAVCQHSMNMSNPKVPYLGCRAGYVLRFDEAATTDKDGAGGTAAINSYVLIGPILGNARGADEIQLSEISAILDRQSGDVSWELLVGESAEDALASAARFQGVWGPGRSVSSRPFARGAAMFLKLSANNQWALETVLMQLGSVGGWRAA